MDNHTDTELSTGPAGDTSASSWPFLIGDTIKFAEREVAAGDIGVIVGRECWLNNHDAVVWDGVGLIPDMVKRPFDYSTLCCDRLGRYLVRLHSVNPETKDRTIGGLQSWRAACLRAPHAYPFVSPRDMVLVSRPQIVCANASGCFGSVMAFDDWHKLKVLSDSVEGARAEMAYAKAASCLPLLEVAVSGGDGSIKMRAQIVNETKVAHDLGVGFTFFVRLPIGGIREAKVYYINDDGSSADFLVVGTHIEGWLTSKQDGWYDQHTYVNAKALRKIAIASQTNG